LQVSCFYFLFHSFQEEGKSKGRARQTLKNVQIWKSQTCAHRAVTGTGEGASGCVSVFWDRQKSSGGTSGDLGKRKGEETFVIFKMMKLHLLS